MSDTQTQAWEALIQRAGPQAVLLSTQDLPTRRVEAWHYTSLKPLAATPWRSAEALEKNRFDALISGLELPESDGRIFFGNGREIVDETSLPTSVMRESLDVQANSLTSDVQERFAAQLNTALRQEGMHLRVPAGVDAGLIVLASVMQGTDISAHLYHRIVLEKGASLTLLEVHTGEGHYLANPQIDVHCEDGAHFRHIKRQAEGRDAIHLGVVSARIAAHGNYDSFTLNQGGLLARHEVVSTLEAASAHTNVNGVQLVDETRVNDITSLIHHRAPECISRQTVRTVLSGAAQGVFQGKILVDQIAQKTDGYQMNQALLLSEKAQINSKPELEIYADDVKCSHGATVGALDEDQLFYLRSRGVPDKQARAILISAFLYEAIEMVGHEVMQQYLLRNLPGYE